jgi:hypothetical protein
MAAIEAFIESPAWPVFKKWLQARRIDAGLALLDPELEDTDKPYLVAAGQAAQDLLNIEKCITGQRENLERKIEAEKKS